MAERVEQLRRYLTEQFQLSGLQITESVMEGPLLRFALVLDEMYVPLVLELTPADDAHVFARKEVFRLFMENDKTVTVSLYPMEQVAYKPISLLQYPEKLICHHPNEMRTRTYVFEHTPLTYSHRSFQMLHSHLDD